MIYLDNSATTFAIPEVREKMADALSVHFGNPSSLHNMGMEGEDFLKESRKIIAGTLKCKEKEILFTSGGTESNNLALIGGCDAAKRKGMHILTTPIEHASVAEPIKHLADLGYETEYLRVDGEGFVDLDDLREKLKSDTIMVSVMAVNNEIGTIEPITEIASIIKNHNKNGGSALFHVDAIQAYGKIPVNLKDGIDLLSVSGHKFHGPKGSGFLYVREGVKVNPIIFGGGQETGKRSGTENVPAIAGLGVACKMAIENLEDNMTNMREIKRGFKNELTSIEGVSFNGPKDDEKLAPHILSVSVKGVRAEVLLHALEDKEIFVSAGSACSSNKPQTSKTLLAIDLDRSLLDSTIRVSLSRFNTKEELEKAAKAFAEIVPALQKYSRH